MKNLKENWQKENLEKTKEVLNEHFERWKQERMFKEMYEAFHPQYTTIELHTGRNWDLDESEISDFYDKLIWEDKIEKKSFFNKIKDILSSFYWGLRYNLWFFLFKTQIIKK